MAEDNKDQKTEDPTAKRLTDTQEKGNFANSKEVTSSFVLLAALLAFLIIGKESTHNLMDVWRQLMSEAHAVNLSPQELYRLLLNVMKNFFIIVFPVLLIIMVGGVVANILQTGGLKFSAHPLMPKFDKLNPLKGFGRIFSKNSLVELLKSLFKVTVVALIAYQTILGHWEEVPSLMNLEVGQTLSFMAKVSLEIIFKVLLLMAFLSILDFAFQKYMFIENNRMTKEEVREERKETEGNPVIKQRIRSVQNEMARRRMMAAVPQADVVVTNPTEIAVAIEYDREKNLAPVVVAKGSGLMAKKIREVALENGVPIVENKPLARVLHKTVDIGQMIPESLYKAVAEILAHVYRLKGKTHV